MAALTPVNDLKLSELPDVTLDVIIDSGAFSAWVKETSVDLSKYIEYIHHFKGSPHTYINLDVIPGAFGRIPSREEVEASAAAGYQNLKLMEKEGLRPMPVFHQGEDFKWLYKMLEDGYDFIGISPANDRTTSQRIVWLDNVFHMLTNSQGEPLVKTHGLAATGLKILQRYPWYSCDSTSWRVAGDLGTLLIPRLVNGVPDYNLPHYKLSVSDTSPALKGENEHLENFTPSIQKLLLDFIESTGHSLSHLQIDYKERNSFNIKYTMALERSLVHKPYKGATSGLISRATIKKFAPNGKAHEFFSGSELPHIKMIFAVIPTIQTSLVLNQNESTRRLFSYWYFGMVKTEIEDVKYYVKTGKVFHNTHNPKTPELLECMR